MSDIENWENAHRTRDVASLSGHSLEVHLQALQVSPAKSDCVLCIGVGTGEWIRDLDAKKWSLDIAQCAEQTAILSGVSGNWSEAEFLPRDFFDLAMSLWVAPHMTDAELQEQIKHVIRSLKPGGVFALQYHGANGGAGHTAGGTMFRSLERIIEMSVGAEVVPVSGNVVHIRKKL
jgi:hypothetical protein